MVNHGVSKDLGDAIVGHIQHCLDYFKDNPVTKTLTEEEAGGYHH
ncbi:MAG: hypothetical protein AAGG81_00300 [Chlamydiota bacterium]